LQHHVTAFDPIEIGHLRLPNRIVMAPMTHSRAAGAGLATGLMARYYAQRASAGLIITEGIQPCVVGQGYPNTPGLHTVEQMRSWRAICSAIGATRTALRISPANPFNDMREPDAQATYLALVDKLRPMRLAYLHVVEVGDRELPRAMRTRFAGPFLLNPHTAPRPTGPDDLRLIDDGTADLISYGALFLANPDLPRRLLRGGPFNKPRPATFYGGTDIGYTDYPPLSDAESA
jgi:2,4-dienoyl-CoA reductase-like NADH-dependent reductase (Old Yellow Enzyme family)